MDVSDEGDRGDRPQSTQGDRALSNPLHGILGFDAAAIERPAAAKVI
jgi:hypothetical protein